MYVSGRKNRNAGYALLYAVFLSAVVAFGLTALLGYFRPLDRVRKSSTDAAKLEVVVKSLLAYGRYALKQQFILTETAGRELDTPARLIEYLEHPRNLARMLLSLQSLPYFNKLLTKSCTDASLQPSQRSKSCPGGIPESDPRLILNELVVEAPYNTITPSHALYPIVSAMPDDSNVSAIRFRFKRSDNVNSGNSGARGTTYVRVEVELVARRADIPILGNRMVVRGVAEYGFYPEELIRNALVVQNLILNQSASYDAPWGRFHIPSVPKSELGERGGVYFYSPVRVNDRIEVFDAPHNKARGFNSTGFGDLVIVGGQVEEAQPGSPPTEWVPTFGGDDGRGSYSALQDRMLGFLGGVEKGNTNQSLAVLFRSESGEKRDTSLRDYCVRRGQVLTDLRKTSGDSSMLVVKSTTGTRDVADEGREYATELHLTGQNFFSRQGRGGIGARVIKAVEDNGKRAISYPGKAWPAVSSDDEDDTASVVRVELRFLNDKTPTPGDDGAPYHVEATLPVRGRLQVAIDPAAAADKRKVELEDEISDLNKDIKGVEKNLSGWVSALAAAKSGISSLESAFKSATADYNAATDKALLPGLKSKMDKAEEEYGNAKSILSSYPDKIEKSQDLLDHSRADLATREEERSKVLYYRENAPVIQVVTSRVEVGGHEQSDRLGLTVSTRHEDTMKFLGLRMFANVRAFEVGHDGGEYSTRGLSADEGSRPTTMPFNLVRYDFARKAGDVFFGFPDGIGSSYSVVAPGAPPGAISGTRSGDQDRYALDRRCDSGSPIPYDIQSFDATARNSWHHEPPLSPDGIMRYDGANAGPGAVSDPRLARWTRVAIANEVVVEPSARLVTGFVATDVLRILPRTEPLTFVGTFLVSKAVIAPAAVKSGIRFYSIYHETAIRLLRDANRLGFGHDCHGLFENAAAAMQFPPWHPNPSLLGYAALNACHPAALQGQYPNPFRAAISPPCGTLADGTQMCIPLDNEYGSFQLSAEIDL